MGTIIAYYGKIAPANYLICDGSEYNKSDYPELWTHLSILDDITPYTVDGDNKKFKVPDLRGEFLRGSGTNSHTNQGSGSAVGEHQDATEHITFYQEGKNAPTYYTTYDKNNRAYMRNIDSMPKTSSDGGFATINWNLHDHQSTEKYYTSRPTNTSVLFCIATKNFTIGDVSNNYSTEEQVIGTWIDGKKLYQKTVTGTYNTDTFADLGLSPEFAQVVVATAHKSGYPWQTLGRDDILSNLWVRENGQVACLASDSEMTGATIYVTIQYTKTTDV